MGERVRRAIALWLLLTGMAVGGFAMVFAGLGHDESHELSDMKRAMQESVGQYQ